MTHPRIIITISDGQVVDVIGLPEPFEIEVRDYDLPEDWDENELQEHTVEDAMGERYQGYTMIANVATPGGYVVEADEVCANCGGEFTEEDEANDQIWLNSHDELKHGECLHEQPGSTGQVRAGLAEAASSDPSIPPRCAALLGAQSDTVSGAPVVPPPLASAYDQRIESLIEDRSDERHYHLLIAEKRYADQTTPTEDEAKYGMRMWQRRFKGRKLDLKIEAHDDEACPEYLEMLAHTTGRQG